MKILAFGFSNTISQVVAESLDAVQTKIIDSNPIAINKFLDQTDFNEYDYVIGIGAYGGRGQKDIRIETTFTSQFRNDKTNFQKVITKPFLQVQEGFTYANKAGNSYCNLVSYGVVTRYPATKYIFLHVPSASQIDRVVRRINRAITSVS